MKHISWCFVLTLLVWSPTGLSFAEKIHDGITLKEKCAYAERAQEGEQVPLSKALECFAYINGVVDGYSEAEPKYPLCPHQRVSIGQQSLVVMRFLRNHPEELHKNSAYLVLRAIDEAFPCKK